LGWFWLNFILDTHAHPTRLLYAQKVSNRGLKTELASIFCAVYKEKYAPVDGGDRTIKAEHIKNQFVP
jgi:hypothetical protein